MANNKTGNNDMYPCVAFFIVFESSKNCNQETFFAVLHNQDVEPEITAARQLFQTVKDDNNAAVQEMVNVSNT